MPAGSKRPYTKERKLQSAANKAESDFIQNRAKLSDLKGGFLDTIEAVVRATKDRGKRKKMEATKKAVSKSPKGVSQKTVYSKKGWDSSGLNWTELSVNKDGVYKTK